MKLEELLVELRKDPKRKFRNAGWGSDAITMSISDCWSIGMRDLLRDDWLFVPESPRVFYIVEQIKEDGVRVHEVYSTFELANFAANRVNRVYKGSVFKAVEEKE